MFDFIRFVIRNRGAQKVRGLTSVRKAMKEFATDNRECAWCGRSEKLDVHHIEPVSVAPEKAGDKDNMLILCRKPPCHQIVGHDGDFGSRYVENVREICDDNLQRVVKILRE